LGLIFDFGFIHVATHGSLTFNMKTHLPPITAHEIQLSKVNTRPRPPLEGVSRDFKKNEIVGQEKTLSCEGPYINSVCF